jgi:TRAP-type C4-dicarboxylate transport system permease small subunit
VLRTLKKVFDNITGLMLSLASLSIFLMMLLITIEVILRQFNKSTLIADEYCGYLMVATIFFGLGYSFKEELFTRVDFVYNKIAKKFVGIFLDKVLLLITLFYATLMVYFVYELTIESYRLMFRAPTVSQTPLYLPQSIMVIGCTVFFLQILIFLFSKKRLKKDKSITIE